VTRDDLVLPADRLRLLRPVSKYIGETEKALGRLFDEADAHFGKRSAVKDSHDRYANLETSYLLQRLERFSGLAILTTNLGANLDEAFTRRISVGVDFPLPGPNERMLLGRQLQRAVAWRTEQQDKEAARAAQAPATRATEHPEAAAPLEPETGLERRHTESSGVVQAQAEVGLAGGALSSALSGRIQAKHGSGSSLDPGTRTGREAVLGTGFSGVTIHTDGEADAQPAASSGTLHHARPPARRRVTHHRVHGVPAADHRPAPATAGYQVEPMAAFGCVRVRQGDDISLHVHAAPAADAAVVAALPACAKVYVEQRLQGARPGDVWYRVAVPTSPTGYGYVVGWGGYLDLGLPDPGSVMDYVTKGEGALAIANRHYTVTSDLAWIIHRGLAA